MIRNHHPRNERIKRQYATWLEEAQRMNSRSVDQALAAIAQFEASTDYKDFGAFHIEQARKFKRLLEAGTDTKSGQPVAKATAAARLNAVKRFFVWLAGQPGYKSKLSYSDADYFNPSNHDARIASARREKPVPSLEQIRHVLRALPSGTDIEKRDRALVAFILLTGARDDAVASASIKHVDITARRFDQDARDIRTKFRKTFATWFFPVGDDVERIVTEWIAYLRETLLFGPTDPLFPATKMTLNGDGHFATAGLDRRHWSNADPIRRIFREAFATAGLPYFNPHSFRSTLAQLGERVCGSPEEFKSWSQNLGHEKVMTTFSSYGTVSAHRQAALMGTLRERCNGGTEPSDAARVADAIRLLQGLAESRNL